MNDHIARLIDDLEMAGHEYAQAAADASDAGHEHGDCSPAANDAYRTYGNWRQIFKDASNTLRTALGIAESRPDVDAYAPTAED